MAFIFSEEEITNMYGMYQTVLTEIQDLTQGISEKLGSIAVKLKYKPVVDLSKESLIFYNDELKNSVLRAMEDWQNSDASFSWIMDKMNAGDDAKERSKQLEEQIIDEVNCWKTLDLSELESIDTTNWKCQVSDFEEIKGIVKTYIENLEELQMKYTSQIENKTEENTIYVSIEPVILSTIVVVANGFSEGINESFSHLADEFATKEQEAKNMGANAAEQVEQKSQSFVNAGIQALKAKVKTIID